jgi:hypothetical protein
MTLSATMDRPFKVGPDWFRSETVQPYNTLRSVVYMAPLSIVDLMAITKDKSFRFWPTSTAITIGLSDILMLLG